MFWAATVCAYLALCLIVGLWDIQFVCCQIGSIDWGVYGSGGLTIVGSYLFIGSGSYIFTGLGSYFFTGSGYFSGSTCFCSS